MRLLKNKKLLGIKITIEQRDTIDETNSIIDTAKDIAWKILLVRKQRALLKFR